MDKYDKLRELKSLFDSGLLTETEFTKLKEELLFEKFNDSDKKDENNISVKLKNEGKIFEEIKAKNNYASENDYPKKDSEKEKPIFKNLNIMIALIISSLCLIFFINYYESGYKRDIKKICSDCDYFEEIEKSTFVLVKNKEGKSNVYDTKLNKFILKNWYEANYDGKGIFYDDITFIIDGHYVVCPESEYTKLSDDFIAKKLEEAYIRSDSEYNSRGTLSSGSKTCSWCGNSFTGTHYTHLGKISPCQSSSDNNSIGKYCSMKCCNEARRSSCPSCR